MFRFSKVEDLISTDIVYGPLHGMISLPYKRKGSVCTQFCPVCIKFSGVLSHWQFLNIRVFYNSDILILWENVYNSIMTMFKKIFFCFFCSGGRDVF